MEEADQRQETNRYLSLISEKLDTLTGEIVKLQEGVADSPSAGQFIALVQAVQYSGLLQFHRMMLDFAEPVALDAAKKARSERMAVSGPTVEELSERVHLELITTGLAKVPAPPFEKHLKAAIAAAKIRVNVEGDVNDALKAEAAMEAEAELRQQEEGDYGPDGS